MVVCIAIAGQGAGYSAMLGGSIIVLANSWSFWRLIAHKVQGAPATAHTLQRYYRAEAGKFLLLLVLLAALLRPEQPLAWLGWEIDKPFLIMGFVFAAMFIAVPRAKMMSRHYAQLQDETEQIEKGHK